MLYWNKQFCLCKWHTSPFMEQSSTEQLVENTQWKITGLWCDSKYRVGLNRITRIVGTFYSFIKLIKQDQWMCQCDNTVKILRQEEECAIYIVPYRYISRTNTRCSQFMICLPWLHWRSDLRNAAVWVSSLFSRLCCVYHSSLKFGACLNCEAFQYRRLHILENHRR